MPLLEYICPKCQLSWSKRVPAPNPAQDIQPCKRCNAMVARQGLPSALAIERAGTSSATIDHVVGVDAEARWSDFHQKKEIRDQARQELGTPAVTQQADGTYTPVTPERMTDRKIAYKALSDSET